MWETLRILQLSQTSSVKPCTFLIQNIKKKLDDQETDILIL